MALIAVATLSQPIFRASGQSGPQPGDYIVAEQGANDLVRITPAGSKTVVIGNLSGLSFVAIDSQGNYIVPEIAPTAATENASTLSKITPTGSKTVIIGNLSFRKKRTNKLSVVCC